MWTIVWIEAGHDRYDRLNREELIICLRELFRNEDVSEEDILVFPPDAECNIYELWGED